MLWNVEFMRFHSSRRMGATNARGLLILGLRSTIVTNWSPLGNGIGRRRMASMAEKTALLAPMPRARVTMIAIEKDGDLRMKRKADFRFATALSIMRTR